MGYGFCVINLLHSFQWIFFKPCLHIVDIFEDIMRHIDRSRINFGRITAFLAHLSTKCSRWGIVIGLCPSSGVNFCFKRLLLQNCWTDFEIISQKCSLGGLLYQNCSNGSAPLNNMAARAKNRKTFKRLLLQNCWADFEIISQKCSLGGPLPKLLKQFRSTEQYGRQS